MRYSEPRLVSHLASAYVLGTLSPRARRRFERLRAQRTDVALAVSEWETRLGALASARGRAIVCSTSGTEPALPISTTCSPATTSPGRKTMRVLPSSAPSTTAPHRSAAVRAAVRCCRIKPGFFLRARMFSSTNGVPVVIESDSALRRI